MVSMPRRLAVEWITSEETERRTIRLEQLREKRHEPFVVHRRRHRREPHEPVQAEVVWSDLRRAALDVARLPLELVRAPLGRGCEDGIGGPFDLDLEPLLRDRAERAVGPDDMERIEARVHDLPPREQVSRGPIAQEHDEGRQPEHDREIPPRRGLGPVRRQRDDAGERGVIEGRDRERDRDEVQPREVA